MPEQPSIAVPSYEPTGAYRQAVGEVLAALDTDARLGLSEDEARARLAEFGPNELAAEPAIPAWRRFLAQFTNVLVILLLIATAISAGLWVYERDTALPYEAIAIFAIVLLNAAMGYIQESPAEAALTGESLPVSKDPAPIAQEAGLGDRINMVFSGTAATYGRGTAIVTA